MSAVLKIFEFNFRRQQSHLPSTGQQMDIRAVAVVRYFCEAEQAQDEKTAALRLPASRVEMAEILGKEGGLQNRWRFWPLS